MFFPLRSGPDRQLLAADLGVVADIDRETRMEQHALDAPLPDTDEIYKDVLEETA